LVESAAALKKSALKILEGFTHMVDYNVAKHIPNEHSDDSLFRTGGASLIELDSTPTVVEDSQFTNLIELNPKPASFSLVQAARTHKHDGSPSYEDRNYYEKEDWNNNDDRRNRRSRSEQSGSNIPGMISIIVILGIIYFYFTR